MVRRWFRVRGAGWRGVRSLNGVGAATTGLVLVDRHDHEVLDGRLRGGDRGDPDHRRALPRDQPALPPDRPAPPARNGSRGTSRRPTPSCSSSATSDRPRSTPSPICSRSDARDSRRSGSGAEERLEEARERWRRVAPRFDELDAPAGRAGASGAWVLRYLKLGGSATDFVTVVIPEVVTSGSLLQLVRHRSAFLLKTSLLFQPEDRGDQRAARPGRAAWSGGRAPDRASAERGDRAGLERAGRHRARARSTRSRSSRPRSRRSTWPPIPRRSPSVVEAWHDRRMDVPLVLVEAAFRDLGPPFLEEIRSRTARGDTVVTVVLPELVPEHWWQTSAPQPVRAVLQADPASSSQTWSSRACPFHLSAPETLRGAIGRRRSADRAPRYARPREHPARHQGRRGVPPHDAVRGRAVEPRLAAGKRSRSSWSSPRFGATTRTGGERVTAASSRRSTASRSARPGIASSRRRNPGSGS